MSGKYAENEWQLRGKDAANARQCRGNNAATTRQQLTTMVETTTRQIRGNHAANERQLAQKYMFAMNLPRICRIVAATLLNCINNLALTLCICK
jgi:hypothetical protein